MNGPIIGPNGRPRPVDEAMLRIVSTITQMPFRGMVPVEYEPSSTDDEETFIELVADWLARYRTVIANQSDTFTRQANQLRRFTDLRDQIRSFLGTLPEDA